MDVYKAITAAVANIVKHTLDKPEVSVEVVTMPYCSYFSYSFA